MGTADVAGSDRRRCFRDSTASGAFDLRRARITVLLSNGFVWLFRCCGWVVNRRFLNRNGVLVRSGVFLWRMAFRGPASDCSPVGVESGARRLRMVITTGMIVVFLRGHSRGVWVVSFEAVGPQDPSPFAQGDGWCSGVGSGRGIGLFESCRDGGEMRHATSPLGRCVEIREFEAQRMCAVVIVLDVSQARVQFQ